MKLFKFLAILLTCLLVSHKASAAIVPTVGAWGIDTEMNGSPGRGFQIDYQYGTMVLTFYGYAANGAPQYYISAGTVENDKFTASLNTYANGTPFGATYRAGVSTGSAGTVTVTFSDSTHGLITLPGESPKAISRLVFAAPPVLPVGKALSDFAGPYIATVTSSSHTKFKGGDRVAVTVDANTIRVGDFLFTWDGVGDYIKADATVATKTTPSIPLTSIKIDGPRESWAILSFTLDRKPAALGIYDSIYTSSGLFGGFAYFDFLDNPK